jgi:hypothetical protein
MQSQNDVKVYICLLRSWISRFPFFSKFEEGESKIEKLCNHEIPERCKSVAFFTSFWDFKIAILSKIEGSIWGLWGTLGGSCLGQFLGLLRELARHIMLTWGGLRLSATFKRHIMLMWGDQQHTIRFGCMLTPLRIRGVLVWLDWVAVCISRVHALHESSLCVPMYAQRLFMQTSIVHSYIGIRRYNPCVCIYIYLFIQRSLDMIIIKILI